MGIASPIFADDPLAALAFTRALEGTPTPEERALRQVHDLCRAVAEKEPFVMATASSDDIARSLERAREEGVKTYLPQQGNVRFLPVVAKRLGPLFLISASMGIGHALAIAVKPASRRHILAGTALGARFLIALPTIPGKYVRALEVLPAFLHTIRPDHPRSVARSTFLIASLCESRDVTTLPVETLLKEAGLAKQDRQKARRRALGRLADILGLPRTILNRSPLTLPWPWRLSFFLAHGLLSGAIPEPRPPRPYGDYRTRCASCGYTPQEVREAWRREHHALDPISRGDLRAIEHTILAYGARVTYVRGVIITFPFLLRVDPAAPPKVVQRVAVDLCRRCTGRVDTPLKNLPRSSLYPRGAEIRVKTKADSIYPDKVVLSGRGGETEWPTTETPLQRP